MSEYQQYRVVCLVDFLYLKGVIIRDIEGIFNGFLPDSRLEKRADKIMVDMFNFGKAVVNKFSSTLSDKIGAYRMFNNKSYSYKDLSLGLYNACKANIGCHHVLSIQDTTEVNYAGLTGRIDVGDKDIGPVRLKYQNGFFCHPSLVVDAKDRTLLGFSNVHIWNREKGGKNKHERNYQFLPITEKESYRWIDSAMKSKKVLSKAPMVTIIGDRESDIYEEFVDIPDQKTHILVRSRSDRKLYKSKEKLYETLAQKNVECQYNLSLKGNNKRKSRNTSIEVRYTKVKLLRPSKCDVKKYPKHVELWAIEAREVSKLTPEGEEPILWRLLTTHSIQEPADAISCIKWYKDRWLIEELFRVIKTKGLEVESAQMGSGAALKKLTVMSLQIAISLMNLKHAIDQPDLNINAKVQFTNAELKLLSILLIQVEGQTAKQKNPYRRDSMAWATWILARLGNWSGYGSHGPPGYITIKNGLNAFNLLAKGYEIDRKDVYKD